MRKVLAFIACLSAAAPAFAAPSALPPVAAYGRLPAIELVNLSPSGDRAAAVVVAGEKRDLVIFDVKARKAIGRSPVGSTKVRSVRFAGEDFVLVTVTGTYDFGVQYATRYELAQVAIVDLKTSTVRWVFDKGAMINVVLGEYGLFQEDGRWAAYYSGYEKGENGPKTAFPGLYRVDLETGDSRRVFPGADYGPRWLLAPDGVVLATSEYDDADKRWRLYRGRDRKALIAEGSSDVRPPLLDGLGRTPDTVAWWRPREDGGRDLVESSLRGDRPDVVIDEPGKRIAGVLRDPGSRLLAGLQFEGARSGFRWFDARRQARAEALVGAFPAEQTVEIEAIDEAFEDVALHVSGDGESGAWWVVNLKSGDADTLGASYPAVKSEHVGSSRLVRYKAADGLELEGVLTLPPGREAGKLPLVVLPHGGPESYDSPGFDWWAQAYASRGYAVWQPNFRGSSGYGPALTRAGWGEWGRKMQTDVSDGVAELARQGVVDPARACVVGGSYGGYVALAGVTIQNGIYRCAVAVAGVSDLRAMLMSERNVSGELSDTLRYWRTFMGAKSPTDSSLVAISPSEVARRADAPVLLIHGKDDTVVPIEQSRIMERALRRAGKPVEFLELPGEDHWLSKGETRQQMLEAAVAFVLKHNPPD